MELEHGNHNDDGRTATCARRPSLPGMRRSCSECGRRKKICDGRRPCGEIRGSMVKMMTILQPSAVGGDFGEHGRFDAIARGADWSKVSEGHQIPMNPSSCTFWCAIALGALVKGHPIESVTKYSQLAHDALAKSNSGPVDAEVAKAWGDSGLLARLDRRLGEVSTVPGSFGIICEECQKTRFHRCSSSAADIADISTCPMQPCGDQGFSEVVTYAEISDSCCEQRQMKSLIAEEESIFQLNEAAAEGEIYQHVAQSFKAFEQASHATANAQMWKTRETQSKAEGDGRSRRVHPSDDPLLCMAISNAMGTVLQSGRCIDFEPLEATVDRPSFGEGVGSLFINMALVFEKGVKGDLQASMERLRRCVEVYERYPGLCRGTIGHHKAHFVLICLAAIKDSRARAMYERLRSFYNSFRPAGALPVPPFDEWHGVTAFCDFFYCRAVEGLVASEHMKDFAGSPVDRNDVGDSMNGTDRDEGQAAPLCDVNTRHGRRSAGYIPQNIIDTDSDWPSESRTDGVTGSSVVSTPPASPVFFYCPCCQSEARVHYDRFESSACSVVVAPELLSRLLTMGRRGGVAGDADDECIGAGNWLDVTHAMLNSL